MPLSWNEIRLQASNFVNEWKDRAPKAKKEADAQDFQTENKGIGEQGLGFLFNLYQSMTDGAGGIA